MTYKILSEQEVKEVISKQGLLYREFFNINKIVYGAVEEGEVKAMIPTSNNVELENTRKIYSMFTMLERKKSIAFLDFVVKELKRTNEFMVIYTDCLGQDKHIFEAVGFRFTKEKKNLKRYGSLHRGVFYS